ncbi:hypothetical protein [Bacillus sp. FJAT-44742]|uniref:hypothetical protein n=1 Tax=Bacillus sp. FJAT-44742 TaxID=2014005 RepID=UPI000C24A242|nr:hypothetical protein [Bacillus sp. FJAT-44742]
MFKRNQFSNEGMESWKIAVQEAVNNVVAESLLLPPDQRTELQLLDIMKKHWRDEVSPLWFTSDTLYYLWLIHAANHLLPRIENEDGYLAGYVQYKEFPRALSTKHLTVPLVREQRLLKGYVFEKEATVNIQIAEAVSEMIIHSESSSPSHIAIFNIEAGKWSIYRMNKRKVY